MPSSGCGDIAILDGHRPTRLLQQPLLVGPSVRGRNIEAKNTTLQSSDAPNQPLLQSGSRSALLRSDPISKLSDHDGAREAVSLFPLQPIDDSAISMCLHGLRQHIGIKQPTHNFSFFGSSRLRGGRSSIGTGHSFQTFSQSARRLMRRRVTTSSSGSKVASN
jgi:hypothetical protein